MLVDYNLLSMLDPLLDQVHPRAQINHVDPLLATSQGINRPPGLNTNIIKVP